MAEKIKRLTSEGWKLVNSARRIGGMGGGTLKIFDGTDAPETFDGIWFKTADGVVGAIIEIELSTGDPVWGETNPMPYPCADFGAAVLGTKIYAIGGYLNSDGEKPYTRRYDKLTGVWTIKTPFPQNIRQPGCNAMDGKVGLFGGYSFETGVALYDEATDTWAIKTPYTYWIRACAVALRGSQYAIIGGYSTSGQVTLYNPATDAWSLLSSIAKEAGPTIGQRGNDVYSAVTGYQKGWTLAINLTTGAMRQLANVPNNYYSFTGGMLGDDFHITSPDSYPLLHYQLNALTEAWTTGSQLLDSGCNAAEAVTIDNVMYLISGLVPGTGNPQAIVRTLTAPAYDYSPGTAVLLTGKAPSQEALGTTKLLDNMHAYVEDAWIYNGSRLVSYETYVGNGTSWELLKAGE